MSWIQKLYETYEQCADSVQPVGPMLWPTSHFVKRAHIEVVIDKDGNFRPGRARRLEWNESPTLIPSTEASAGRTAGVAPHPLCEEIAYSNIDFAAGPITDAQSAYLKLLADWCESTHAHPKACAVFAYVQKGELRKDLFEEGLFPVAMANSRGQKTKIEDQKVFVRWRVEELGSPCSGTWEDQTLIQSWIEFDKANNDRTGFCMVTGRQARLALNHSRFLRWPGDGAKLISANDYSGFTFKGRFTDDKKDYENHKNTFTPTTFATEKWATAAKNAGMKYVVFTTKHHDGFCMFDTKQTDYKITKSPFGSNPRSNVAKEVFGAFRNEGFMIAAYFSKPDWHTDAYWWSYFQPKYRTPSYNTENYPRNAEDMKQ